MLESSSAALSCHDLFTRANVRAAEVKRPCQAGRPFLLRAGNVFDFPIWFLAALLAERAVFPISPATPPASADRLARLSGAVVAADAGSLNEISPHEDHTACQLGQPGSTTIGPHAPIAPGLLLTSSGTTSLPRVVHRSAASLDAVAQGMVEALGLSPRDRVLAAVPLSHSYGLEHGLLGPLWSGATGVLTEGMGPSTLARLRSLDLTVLPAVPALIEMLISPASPIAGMTSLRLVYSAGAPLPNSLHERFRALSGLRVGQVYGMTEIGSVTFNNPSEAEFDAESVGRPMPGVSLLCVDPDSRVAARQGSEGELLVRAPSMLSGYLHEHTPFEDGHFVTGDLGRIDARGRATITGRRRLLIDTGGLKVNPLEVEAVLCEHPGVRECVVLPITQSGTVARLRALVVARDPSRPPSEQSLRELARSRLPTGKIPRMIELVPSLPRTPSGKIARTSSTNA